MKKKIQIITIISLLLMSTNFICITTANNPIKNQSLASLVYEPKSHDFGDIIKGDVDNTTFEIWNGGCCYLYYDLYEYEEWIEVDPIEGGSTGEHDNITVTINTTNLTLGMHEANITIISNQGEGNFTVKVNVITNNLIDISVDEAWDLLSDTSNGIQIPIDVRTYEEWETEHIDTPNPENPRHHNYLEWTDPNILQDFISTYKGKQIILYCKGGSRSKEASIILIDNEFNGIVYNMDGGLNEWKNQGYPTEGHTTLEIMNLQSEFGSISVNIKNNGTFETKNISIEMSIVGGFFSGIDFTSSNIDCQTPLPPDQTKTESTRKDGLIFGFGPIEITVSIWAKNADKITIKQEGFVIGFFIIIK